LKNVTAAVLLVSTTKTVEASNKMLLAGIRSQVPRQKEHLVAFKRQINTDGCLQIRPSIRPRDNLEKMLELFIHLGLDKVMTNNITDVFQYC